MTAAALAAPPEIPAFRELFDANVRSVYRFVLHLGVPERNAEDVTQEVFVVAHRRLGECTDGEHLRSWLYAIAWRVAAAHRRRAHNQREIPTECAGELLADDPEPLNALDDRRRLERLNRALEALPEDQRVVFVLYEVEELVMREIADTVGCSLNTAFSRLYAARRRVASALGVEVPREVWKR